MRSGSLDTDALWPRFGPLVGHLGVHSALSLPLLIADGVLGAMNVYAHARDAFDDRAALVGELFAVPAAIAVQNAQVLAQAKRLATQLQASLTSRTSQRSQSENQKVHTVAGGRPLRAVVAVNFTRARGCRHAEADDVRQAPHRGTNAQEGERRAHFSELVPATDESAIPPTSTNSPPARRWSCHPD